MSRRSRFRSYLFFTGCFTLCWFLFKFGGIPDLRQALASTMLDTVLNLSILVCTVEWLLPAYYYRSKYGRFGLLLGCLILAGGTINILGQLALHGMSLFAYREGLARYKDHFFYWFWSDLVAGSYFMLAVIALGGFAIRLAIDRLRTELEALKNQLNPHFIFNALNTIYYTIDFPNAQARELTQRFSSLLRYQLYECNDPTVPVEKEMRYIEDYIALQRQRAGDPVDIRCHGLDDLAGFAIPPHLLMPLVENCFKHVSRFPDKPNFIHLSGSRVDNEFRFVTRNTWDPSRTDTRGGIGLSVTRKRLLLLHNHNSSLASSSADGVFTTTLQFRIA